MFKNCAKFLCFTLLLWHIQNPEWLLHIQNPTIFRILVSLEPNRLIISILILIIITLTFFFFTLILRILQRNLKRNTFLRPQLRQFQCSIEPTQIIRNLWKQHYNRINIHKSFLGNKFYDRKESFLTKYQCIRSKCAVF